MQFEMYSSGHVARRGALIVLEGLDRCGKTTQCGRLVSFLEGNGLPVEAWRFPDRNTDTGRMISSYLTNNSQLDDQTIHLLFSANRWEKRFPSFTCAYLLSMYEDNVLKFFFFLRKSEVLLNYYN